VPKEARWHKMVKEALKEIGKERRCDVPEQEQKEFYEEEEEWNEFLIDKKEWE